MPDVNGPSDRAQDKLHRIFFFAVQSGQIQEALSFSSPSPPIRSSPLQDPRSLVNHSPRAIGWSETKEGGEREKGREEDKTGGGGEGLDVKAVDKHRDGMLEGAEHVE